MRKELEIIITPDGDVQITTIGIKGEACLEEVRPLQEALGYVKQRQLTSEFYQEEQEVEITGRTKAGDSHNHRP